MRFAMPRELARTKRVETDRGTPANFKPFAQALRVFMVTILLDLRVAAPKRAHQEFTNATPSNGPIWNRTALFASQRSECWIEKESTFCKTQAWYSELGNAF